MAADVNMAAEVNVVAAEVNIESTDEYGASRCEYYGRQR